MVAHGPPPPATLSVMLRLPEVDQGSKVPKHRQVADALIGQVRAGHIAPGDRLPAVRDIMAMTGVAQATAIKALQFVASAGYGELVRGMGYYVPDRLPPA